jgi:hypothetical protein
MKIIIKKLDDEMNDVLRSAAHVAFAKYWPSYEDYHRSPDWSDDDGIRAAFFTVCGIYPDDFHQNAATTWAALVHLDNAGIFNSITEAFPSQYEDDAMYLPARLRNAQRYLRMHTIYKYLHALEN